MYQKLEEVEARLKAVEEALAEPAVYSNPARVKALARERAGLTATVECYQEFRRTDREMADAQVIFENETDEDLRQLAREETAALRQRKDELERRLNELLMPPDPNDEKDVILEIRGGAGGDEAALFAGDLFRMYSRYAESKGWKVEVLSHHPGDVGGFKEVVASIGGDRVFSVMRYESGVHRVQRVPETEAQGRIHTSTVTVAILPEAEDVDVHIDPADLRIDVYRSSGPGGQSVNTTDSAVRVTHVPTGLVVTCQDEKSQHKNKARALQILRARLLDAEREKADRERSDARRSMVGTGDRSERIRTYNFPQNRLTDHRIGLTLYKLERIVEGDLEEVFSALRAHFRAEALKAAKGSN